VYVEDVGDVDEQLLAGLLDRDPLDLRGRHLGGGFEPADRLPKPLDLDGLDEVVGRLDLERLDRMLAVSRDEDDRRRAREPREHLGKLDTAQAGHLDVEEDDVVGDRLDELQRFDRVACLSDDLDSAGFTQQEAQLRPGRGFVVDHERLEHLRLHQPSRAVPTSTSDTVAPRPSMLSTTTPEPGP
jgi:hypothetical protein